MKIKFYTSKVCPFAHRVWISLIEIFGAANFDQHVEMIEIDLSNKPDWYSKVNPLGKVPALETEDKIILVESSIITEYLFDKYNNNPILYPFDQPEKKALEKMFSSKFDPIQGLFYTILKTAGGEELELKKKELSARFEQLDKDLTEASAEGPFAFGEFSVADILTIPWMMRIAVLQHYRGVEIPSSCNRLNQWIKACAERPSVSTTSPSAQSAIKTYEKYATSAK